MESGFIMKLENCEFPNATMKELLYFVNRKGFSLFNFLDLIKQTDK